MKSPKCVLTRWLNRRHPNQKAAFNNMVLGIWREGRRRGIPLRVWRGSHPLSSSLGSFPPIFIPLSFLCAPLLYPKVIALHGSFNQQEPLQTVSGSQTLKRSQRRDCEPEGDKHNGTAFVFIDEDKKSSSCSLSCKEVSVQSVIESVWEENTLNITGK